MAELPLAGRRIVVTRPRAQAEPLAALLEELGATALVIPLIAIEPADDVELLKESMHDLHRYDWFVVTSANGVAAMVSWIGFSWLRRTVRVAAVGPATAAALRQVGVEPDFVPERFAAEEIAEGLGDLEGARVLLVQSDVASRELGDRLRSLGAHVQTVHLYRTVAVEPSEEAIAELGDGVDAIVLASGSAAHGLAARVLQSAALEHAVSRALLVCIGPKTADVARELGLEVGLVAREATAEGIIQALTSHFGESR